uniref:AT rich interactive domain 4A (RBP1-like) n=1 Tax=Iconisemion striatum TaxID=60296 RepID=A0A1A7W9S9_9TELE
MKAADEPACLTVGTDVSAKYRGAFCEAKIKTVKRMVKVKVTLKGESTSQVIQDDQVKGPLRVGSTVEVRTNEGVCSEAIISKLTDASLYTVVFDDGDEKTLRRTSLCLKGERHFAVSETLDQLPLTNPEHFGTPVIGKKSNRGGRRSSQAVADEENDTSSSDEEEEEKKRLSDELLGHVCSIENLDESNNWFIALVVSPSCNDELVVKKDQCLVRSFYDGKFYTVARRHAHLINSVSITKSDFFNRRGVKEAQMFLKSRDVPDAWKMDMCQILDTSSSEEDKDEKESEEEEEGDNSNDGNEDEDEDEDDDEDEDEKKKFIKEEPEEEADPEERENFLQQLYKFMEDRGTPINKPPVLGYKDLNLFKLFRLVYHQGGCHKIESGTVWKQVYMDLGIPVLNSAASYNVKTAYKKYLYGFEEYCHSASITFRTIHHNKPPPNVVLSNHKRARAELKESAAHGTVELADDKQEESDSESDSEKELKERHSSLRGRRRCGGGRLKLPRPELPDQGENSEEQYREMRRRSSRRMDDSEKGSDEEEDDDEEEEDEDVEETRRNRSENEEDGDSVTGTKVRVKYGRGKTQKIYEAHIKKADNDNGEQFYLVHYYGWNVRYDEWVKADRIIWPAEKGTKRKQRKKVKNKDKDDPEREREKDEEKLTSLGGVKPTGLKRGRPQIRTPPTSSAGRGILRTSGGEGQSNGKFTRMDSSNLANGDDTPRRRTRRTSSMYESDRASNEDSGNSSVDSETDDQPERNDQLLPWRKPGQPEEEQKDAEEEKEIKEEMEMKEESNVAEHADSSPIAMVTSALLSAIPGCPSPLQEKADEELSQSERREEAQGAEPFGEPAMMSSDLDRDSRTCPVPSTVSFQCQNKMSPGQEVLHETALHMMILQGEAATSPRATEDSNHSSPQPSPRVKGRRANLREADSETLPVIPFCSGSPPDPSPCTPQAAVLSSSPRSILKRQDEPMVVLHCLSSQHLLPKSSSANSDTDSATEEEEEEEGGGLEPSPQERLKQKLEQSPSDKKVCLNRIPEDASPKNTSPIKALVSPPHPERRSDVGVRANNLPHPVEDPQSKQAEEHLDEEPELHAGSPPPIPEVPAPVSVEELEPQIGPEALVCHEVDLDDPDDKEKPSSSSEHLLMLRDQQEALSPLPLIVHSCLTPHSSPHPPQPQVRPFLLAPKPTTCPKELHPVNEASEEEQGASRGEPEGDFSPGFEGSASSSTTSLLSLQENKDRGQKRVSDCSSSPSAKKHKRSQKRPHAAAKVDKNGAGHSSDSEDQSRLLSLSKPQKSRCPGLSSPSAHSKDKQSPSPHHRSYKWTLQLDELDSMSSAERISFLQEKLQEMKKYYMSLKSEVASIDRRRKRLKKKEREVSNTTASTSSGSSDTGMSPSSASPTQNTVAVECR